MGSPSSEANQNKNKKPYDVTLTHAYLIDTTEVTQKQWETVMGGNPSSKEASSDSGPVSLLNPSYPVQNVSWCDAVGSYTANAYGLKDMSGNVWEWTWDAYGDYPTGSTTADPTGATEGPFRVFRGGSWSSTADFARAAYRSRFYPGYRGGDLGLRLSRTIP